MRLLSGLVLFTTWATAHGEATPAIPVVEFTLQPATGAAPLRASPPHPVRIAPMRRRDVAEILTSAATKWCVRGTSLSSTRINPVEEGGEEGGEARDALAVDAGLTAGQIGDARGASRQGLWLYDCVVGRDDVESVCRPPLLQQMTRGGVIHPALCTLDVVGQVREAHRQVNDANKGYLLPVLDTEEELFAPIQRYLAERMKEVEADARRNLSSQDMFRLWMDREMHGLMQRQGYNMASQHERFRQSLTEIKAMRNVAITQTLSRGSYRSNEERPSHGMPTVAPEAWDETAKERLLYWAIDRAYALEVQSLFAMRVHYKRMAITGAGMLERNIGHVSRDNVHSPSVYESGVEGENVVLENFSYLHRCAAALSAGMFKDDKAYGNYKDFAEKMQRSGTVLLDSSNEEHKIHEYWNAVPLDRNMGTKDLYKAMEGNPYAAAYAIFYMVEHQRDAKSTSPYFPFKWSEQPFEIDLYLPSDVVDMAETLKVIDGTTTWSAQFDRLISTGVRVGHAGVIGMGVELKDGCGVTESELSGVPSFMALGSWFRTFNLAMRYLSGEIGLDNVSTGAVMLESMSPYTFWRKFNVDMGVVLDFKCRFDTVVLDAVLQSVNRQFGVHVQAVGSFYKLPALLPDQHSRFLKDEHGRPALLGRPEALKFFFSVEEAYAGRPRGGVYEKYNRYEKGDRVLVTAASLLEVEYEELDKSGLRRLWEALPLVDEKQGKCIGLKPREDALRLVDFLGKQLNIKMGIWTLEAELGGPALSVINELANNVERFPLGFALGGEHDPSQWKNQKCEDIGGRTELGVISAIMANPDARESKAYETYNERRWNAPLPSNK